MRPRRGPGGGAPARRCKTATTKESIGLFVEIPEELLNEKLKCVHGEGLLVTQSWPYSTRRWDKHVCPVPFPRSRECRPRGAISRCRSPQPLVTRLAHEQNFVDVKTPYARDHLALLRSNYEFTQFTGESDEEAISDRREEGSSERQIESLPLRHYLVSSISKPVMPVLTRVAAKRAPTRQTSTQTDKS